MSRAQPPGSVADDSILQPTNGIFPLAANRSVTPFADWASKWLSCFQSRKSSTASLRATAVRARLAPQRLTIFNPQFLRAEAPVTVVSRQLAARRDSGAPSRLLAGRSTAIRLVLPIDSAWASGPDRPQHPGSNQNDADLRSPP